MHFAGGNRYSFDFIRPYMEGVEVVPTELPGRGKRVHERLLHDVDEAVDDLCSQVIRHLNAAGFLLYGHSLGAMLALKLADKLERIGQPPVHVLVSGNPGPGIEDHSEKSTLSKEALRKELKTLGRFPAGFFQVDELFDFYEPILRADFALAKGDNCRPVRPLSAPIYAMAGSEEGAARHLDNWKQFTTSCFRSEIFPGDHFFIHEHPQRIATIIKACLI